MTKTHHIHVQMTLSQRACLDEVQRLSESESMSETLRRSLRFYEWVLETHRAGGRILIDRGDGELREIVLVP